MELKILRQDGGDVTFAVPWKNNEIIVRYEAPAGCIMGGFRFDIEDDDEAEKFEAFLYDRIDISTKVILST